MLGKFEQNCMVQTTRNFWAFWPKNKTKQNKQKKTKNKKKQQFFYNKFWQQFDVVLKDISVAEIIV